MIELEAASVQALVLKNSDEAPTTNGSPMLLNKAYAAQSCEARWDFVFNIINEQNVVQKFCGDHYERCLKVCLHTTRSYT